MSFVGRNIKKIRTVKKMSQAAFAEQFSLARPSIGAYEEGRAEPRIDTLITIARAYDLKVDDLLTKELTINDILHYDPLSGPKKASQQSIPLVRAKKLKNFRPRGDDYESVVFPGIDADYIFELLQGDRRHDLEPGDYIFCKVSASAGLAFAPATQSLSEEEAGEKKYIVVYCLQKNSRHRGLLQRMAQLEEKIDLLLKRDS